jgi:hypothetical protein
VIELRAVLVSGLIALNAACHPTAAERVIIRRWLLCEECNRGELEEVAALGDRATGMLAEALEGPPDSGRAYIRRQAQERFTRLPAPGFSQAAFVAHYDSNYIATYQRHAATALGRIGTPAALAALYSAMQKDSLYRADVIRAMSAAAPITLDTVTTTVQAAPRDSAVRIDPTVMLVDTVSGLGVPNIRIAFLVDSGGGEVTDSIRRTSANGSASTHWILGPGPDSTNVLRATAFRRNVIFRAVGHGLTPRLVFAVQPSNVQAGHTMAPSVRVVALDGFDQPDTLLTGLAKATVVGTSYSVSGPIMNGIVDLPTLAPPLAGANRQLLVSLVGATEVVSQPFDVTP